MADFTQNSKFNSKANYQSVKFGADAPLLETELNELQDIQSEARADIVREAIPSGFTQLSDLDYTFMATNPNTVRTLTDSVAFVNGYKITIPAGTVIPLSAPPTKDFVSSNGKKGTREDLVFLEVWKEEVDYTKDINSYGGEGQGKETNNIKDPRVGIETSRRIQLKYRIRVVDDVDFETHMYGLRSIDEFWNGKYIYAQGGNDKPTDSVFTQTGNKVDMGRYGGFTYKDYGLYIAWKGDDSHKSYLKTVDGYVYAIPMLRVHRRNDGGYSVNNGNGAKIQNYFKSSSYVRFMNGDWIKSVTLTKNIANSLKVGEILYRKNNSGAKFKVVSIDNEDIVTLENITGSNLTLDNTDDSSLIPINSDRPDNLFANIIVDRDIMDLRHQVSLTGFNYQQLLEENFDKLLRGELQTKERTKMLKTYHGIPRTPIDSNTIFYASFDGTTVAEKGGAPIHELNTKYAPGVTGLSTKSEIAYELEYSNTGTYTFDIMGYIFSDLPLNYIPILRLEAVDSENNVSRLFSLETTDTANLLQVHSSIKKLVACKRFFAPTEFHHFRIVKANTQLILYMDGKKVWEMDVSHIPYIEGKYKVLINTEYRWDSKTYIKGANAPVSNLSISNIDRGDNFATLPQDFINGYAQIMPAFNEQRSAYSDAMTSEYKCEEIKCSGETKKQYIIKQATPGKWAQGDTIKLKGLTGEIVSGVFDTDTALSQVLSYENGATHRDDADSVSKIKISPTNKLTVGDYINLVHKQDFFTPPDFLNLKITSISNDVLTLDKEVSSGNISQYYVLEVTATTSSPLIKYNNGENTAILNGTWSGLGTNEATFTVSLNTGLTNQDLTIEYCLNEIAGQGGISEVLTETLAGEYKGQRLVVNSNVHIVDDFKGKVAGSVVENPNIGKVSNKSTSLLTPNDSWNEFNVYYSSVDTLDGSTNDTKYSANVKDVIPQQLFSFNIVEIVERKFGKIPTLDKVKWCKDNIANITCNWYGYGSCPSGNKAYFIPYNNVDSAWATGWANNIASVASKLAINIELNSEGNNKYLDNNGLTHFLAYTDASDGITSSTIFTDYVNVEVTLKTSAGYNVLSPENPRAREGGQSNILLVRKETREIQTMFPCDNNSGVVTYGDYNPFQGDRYNTAGTSLLELSHRIFVTTQGTGKPGLIPYAERLFIGRSSVNIGDLKPYMMIGEDIYSPDTQYSHNKVYKSNAFEYVNMGEYDDSVCSGIAGHPIIAKPISPQSIKTYFRLILKNGEILTQVVSARNSMEAYTNMYKLTNRPLIK